MSFHIGVKLMNIESVLYPIKRVYRQVLSFCEVSAMLIINYVVFILLRGLAKM